MKRYLVAASALLLASVTAQANPFSYSTSSGAIVNGVNVGGTADFDITGAHTFSITLSNTIPSITTAGQLLTDLQFNFGGMNVTMTGSL